MVIFIIVIILFIAGVISLKYNVEGEANLPFELSKISIISSVEGTDNEDAQNKWNLTVNQNNDIYLYIKKNDNYKNTEIIQSIVLDNFNIQQSLWNFNSFILEKILSPLYEKNELKLQNNDNILKLLKDKICGTLEIFAPKIQNIVDKLIAENKTLRNEFEQFKKNYKNEIKEKDEEVLSRKLILDKREEEMKERELTVGETLKHEQLKFDKLKEKYNKEINEKNAKIEELMKVSKTLSKTNDTSGTNVNNINNIQIQELQKDYNDITNIFVNYKLLVNKLITDEDFFFENRRISKKIKYS